MRPDFQSHRLINVAQRQTYSDRQSQSVVFTSLQNVSKCAFAINLMFLFIISTNSDSNLDRSYTLNSFRILRTRSICRIHLFEQFTNLHIWIENRILFIGLWFELKTVTNESLPQINDFTFLSSLPSEHSHSPQIIFVMKITNFVKSAKTSFLTPLTQKCTRVLRTTLLVHYPPSQDRLEDFSQATRSEQSAEPNGMTGTHKTGFLRKRLSYYFVTFLSCCQDESFDVSCSCWWGVTLRGIGWSMSLGRRRTVTCKREVSSLPLYKMSQNVHLQQI